MPSDDTPSSGRPSLHQDGKAIPEPAAPDASGVADAAQPGDWQGSQGGSGLFGGYGSPPLPPVAPPARPDGAAPDGSAAGETGPG